eukprot:TRINITY_DN32526_c0_g1_i1.p1 TRINITY_DN32526_c0_g1~~TRINITY_DN32526_c0_g1_i1.p1  ORF type:complete len:288 (+),score=28.95 TRINITY_DN32526_c0_g1_i1:56-919(+)
MAGIRRSLCCGRGETERRTVVAESSRRPTEVAESLPPSGTVDDPLTCICRPDGSVPDAFAALQPDVRALRLIGDAGDGRSAGPVCLSGYLDWSALQSLELEGCSVTFGPHILIRSLEILKIRADSVSFSQDTVWDMPLLHSLSLESVQRLRVCDADACGHRHVVVPALTSLRLVGVSTAAQRSLRNALVHGLASAATPPLHKHRDGVRRYSALRGGDSSSSVSGGLSKRSASNALPPIPADGRDRGTPRDMLSPLGGADDSQREFVVPADVLSPLKDSDAGTVMRLV